MQGHLTHVHRVNLDHRQNCRSRNFLRVDLTEGVRAERACVDYSRFFLKLFWSQKNAVLGEKSKNWARNFFSFSIFGDVPFRFFPLNLSQSYFYTLISGYES